MEWGWKWNQKGAKDKDGATNSEVWVRRKSSEGLKDEIYLGNDYQEFN